MSEIYTLFWIITAVLITLLVVYIVYRIRLDQLTSSFVNQFNENLEEYCQGITSIVYRNRVSAPHVNGVYEKSLADALTDISFNTGKGVCDNLLPIPNPPGFDQQLRVMGPDFVTGASIMYAYIFWDSVNPHGVISFTGTKYFSEWVENFQFNQVPPTTLNGYKDGVLVHSGFYKIYSSVRDILWNWWSSHKISTLYITGHSLGGALSTICAFDFAKVFPLWTGNTNLIVHYSFAAPRSGNVEYARVFNERLPTSIRVNNTEDLIPQLPPAVFEGWIYKQTGGNAPFTRAFDSLGKNHILAYYDLPTCPETVECYF